MARLLAAPVYVLMLVAWGASWINVVVGFLLAASDGLDGYIARRHGTTRSGAFLDPLADKACVLGAMITLWPRRATCPGCPVDPHRHPRGRHAGLPLLGRPARRVDPGPQVGQAQDAGAGHRDRHRASSRRWPHQHTLQVAAIWFACALTLYTGAEYLLDGRRALHRPAAP